MYKKAYNSIENIVIKQLQALDPRLTYHTVEHTLDVVASIESIAEGERIIDQRVIYLLKVAALYHDTGFLNSYKGHEQESCSIFLQTPSLPFINNEEKELIMELILATCMPQEPQTHLQQIICDADLDYLGRSDFPVISNKLKEELFNYELISTEEEWDRLQLDFMQNHKYHTHTSKMLREREKQINYKELLYY